MRLLCAFVLAAFLSLLPLALGGDRAAAKIVCGMFDGKFGCRNESGAGAQFGKNATPGAKIGGSDDSPETGEQDATDPAAGAGNTRSRHFAGNTWCGRYDLPTRNGRHATQLRLPEELRVIRR